MWSKLLSMLLFEVVALSAMGDPMILNNPAEDPEVYYMGLSESEKTMVKNGAEKMMRDKLVENKTMIAYEHRNGTLNDNCECSHPELDQSECACLFQMPVFDLNIMHALRYNPEDRSMSLVLAIDGYMIINDRVKVSEQAKYKPSCKALPPPTMWMAGCFKMNINEAADGGFTVCGTVDIEIMTNHKSYEKMMSMDFNCFVYEKQRGSYVLKLKDHNVNEGDVGVKNMRVVNNFEEVSEQFNKLKMMRLMKNPRGETEDDSVEGEFWNDVEHNDVESTTGPHQVKAQLRQAKGADVMRNWWTLGSDEIPYLAILFKATVSPELKNVQGLSGSQFIQDTVMKATAQKNSDFHQSVIPDVFKPGLSCGGSLLSADKVLTICACIRSFYYRNKYNKPAPGSGSKFDIDAEDIFVEFAMIQFTNTQYHHLDRNGSLNQNSSACFKAIEEDVDRDLQAFMVVMLFTPRIPTDNPYHYVLWPPYPIHEQYKRRPAVTWMAFGTHNKESQTTDPMLIAVVIPMYRNTTTQYCIQETFNKPDIPAPLQSKTTCFHARDPAYQLCGGLIGFPITYGDNLAGLSASPMDCATKEGSMMGAVFDDFTVREIELNVGNDLKTRREAAHNFLFREPANIVRFIPDYTTVDGDHAPPSSANSINSSNSFVSFLIFCHIVSSNK